MSAIERLKKDLGICKHRSDIQMLSLTIRSPGDLLTEIEQLEGQVQLLCDDWSQDHTHLQDLCRKSGVPEDHVTGDSYGVPAIQDLADMLYAKVAALEEDKKRYEWLKQFIVLDEIDYHEVKDCAIFGWMIKDQLLEKLGAYIGMPEPKPTLDDAIDKVRKEDV